MKEEKKRPIRKTKARAKPVKVEAKEQHKFGQFRLPENVHLKGVVDWKP
jgi:hypothetical protein